MPHQVRWQLTRLLATEWFPGGAVAVLLDATLVRALLLPATMKLLGPRNWYLPRWLPWLPRTSPSGPPARQPPKQPVAVG